MSDEARREQLGTRLAATFDARGRRHRATMVGTRRLTGAP